MKGCPNERVFDDIEPLQIEWNPEDWALIDQEPRSDPLEEQLYDSQALVKIAPFYH